MAGFHQGIVDLFDEMTNLTPVMDEIGEILLSSVHQNFVVGGRYGNDNPFGGGSQKWKKSQRAIEEHGKTLVDTDQLDASTTARVEGNEVIVGTNKVYGRIQHYGGETGRNHSVHLDARPWNVVQDEDLEDIHDAILFHYSKLIGR